LETVQTSLRLISEQVIPEVNKFADSAVAAV
jgi:hypothetical protein